MGLDVMNSQMLSDRLLSETDIWRVRPVRRALQALKPMEKDGGGPEQKAGGAEV